MERLEPLTSLARVCLFLSLGFFEEKKLEDWYPPLLEWLSSPPLLSSVSIPPSHAESLGSGRIGVIGALVFFPSEAV